MRKAMRALIVGAGVVAGATFAVGPAQAGDGERHSAEVLGRPAEHCCKLPGGGTLDGPKVGGVLGEVGKQVSNGAKDAADTIAGESEKVTGGEVRYEYDTAKPLDLPALPTVPDVVSQAPSVPAAILPDDFAWPDPDDIAWPTVQDGVEAAEGLLDEGKEEIRKNHEEWVGNKVIDHMYKIDSRPFCDRLEPHEQSYAEAEARKTGRPKTCKDRKDDALFYEWTKMIGDHQSEQQTRKNNGSGSGGGISSGGPSRGPGQGGGSGGTGTTQSGPITSGAVFPGWPAPDAWSVNQTH